ncbi:response regulator [Cohnella sp. REN36]|uniref:response regulator n=1 Tax=Cohnella sp. REN36 TaxID=2887347 RepID=UPI001D140BC7|nr:response regulator [Cohnella sp. REN36]MCC3377544.1 response regulator [Cohnella sp. REN36]
MKTKLLIVDDEQIEREGLEAILRKGYPDLDIAQAKNGRQAVQMAEAYKPDLILMDIKMPGLDGLEAAEIIGREHPGIKFVMVTAYDTFDYARTAIKLGVKEYLLKPSKASEIVATVGNVLRQIEEERGALEASVQQRETLRKVLPVVETDIVTQLLFDHVHEVHLDELVGLLGVGTDNEKFAMTVLLPPGAEGAYGAVRDKVRRAGSGWVGALYGRQIPIIVFRDPTRSYRSQAVGLARELLSVAAAGEEPGWFVGIGGACPAFAQIRQSYQEALVASMDTSRPVRYRLYEDTPLLGGPSGGPEVKRTERDMFERIRLGEWSRIGSDVQTFVRSCEHQGVDLLQAQQRVLGLLWLASRALLEMGIEHDSPLFSLQARDYRQLHAESALLLERLRESYAAHADRIEPDTVRQIQQYIVAHAHEDISLEGIAKRVGLSPFYLSKVFKEQLGVNYIDFLTECRIDRAKKLMSDPDRSLKEITFEVGYRDPNYFSKVFRKTCGVSPTEYRKTLLGRKGMQA